MAVEILVDSDDTRIVEVQVPSNVAAVEVTTDSPVATVEVTNAAPLTVDVNVNSEVAVVEVDVTPEPTVVEVIAKDSEVNVVEVLIPGPPGPSGSRGMEFNFAFASTTWTCEHNFNSKSVVINIFDNNGDKIVGDVHNDLNITTITFFYAVSGYCRITL